MPKVKGVLTKMFEAVQVTQDFKRRNIIVTTCSDMGRSEYISFELFQDHCKLADSFKEGDKIIVDYNLKGRKWKDAENVEKYFNTLQAWKIVADTSTDE
jgi:hypothetical protein